MPRYAKCCSEGANNVLTVMLARREGVELKYYYCIVLSPDDSSL